MWLTRKAEETIPWDQFNVSYADDPKRGETYLVRAPWDHNHYVTYISTYTLGKSPKYALDNVLEKLNDRYQGQIPKTEVRTAPIADDYPVGRIGTRIEVPSKEERLKDQRKRYWLQKTDPWEVASGTESEDSYKAVNNGGGNENVGLTHL